TLTAGTNGSYLKTQGTSANPTWDTPSGTVYTAGGTLLQLNTNTFSIKEGTLTDTKYCKYVLGTGIVCDYDAGGVTYTATNGLTLNTTAFELGGNLTKATSIALGGFDLNLSGLGNVGIGTTSASYKLDVRGTNAAGQINAEAGLCINGDCKTTWTDSGIGTSVWTTSGNDIYNNNSGDVIFGLHEGGIPTAMTIRGAAAAGTDISGADLTLAASNGTGLGGSGSLIFQTAAPASGITFDNATGAYSASANTLNWSHTNNCTGSSVLLVQVASDSPQWNYPTGVTYNGVALTMLDSQLTNYAYTNYVYYKINPAMGDNQVVANITSTGHVRTTAQTFCNINTATPFGTVQKKDVTYVNSTNISVANVANEVDVDFVFLGGSTATGLAPGANQTMNFSAEASPALAVSSKPGSADVPMSWTWGGPNGNVFGIIAVPLKPIQGTDPNGLANRMVINNLGNVGVGLSSPLAKLHVAGNALFQNSLDSTTAFQVNDASGINIFNVDSTNSRVGIGTTTPLYKLEVNGSAKVSSLNINGAYSLPTAAGTTSEYLRGDGTWAAIAAGMSGTGTTNYLSKFTGASSIGNSLLFDNGIAIGIGTETLAGARFKVALDSTYSNIADPYADETKISDLGGAEVTGGKLQTGHPACGTTYATALDADGNSYNSVLVNDQCWMASNLKVGTRIAGTSSQTNNSVIEKYCYGDVDANCTTDGGLYQWDEAMQYSTTEGAQGICPTGWHIPTDAQQYALENYLKDDGQTCNANRDGSYDCSTAGTKLKFGGTSGLNFPLAGVRNTDGSFAGSTTHMYSWSSSQSNSTSAWSRAVWLSSAGVYRIGNANLKTYGISVRCLKDTDSSFTSFITSTTTSTNLLTSSPAFTINNFHYNIATLPATSSIRIQFSKDNTNWYSASGTLSVWTTISTLGGADIDLADFVTASSWTNGNAFYYRVEINSTTDHTQTPTIEDIRLDYVPLSGSGGLVFDTNGNFGVGTFSPTAKLSIAGSGIGTGQLANFTNGNAESVFTILDNGSIGIGTTSPTAYLNIKAGTATAGTAPLKFTTGTLLSATEGGAMEFDGSHIYFTATNAGTRYQLDQQSGTSYTATNGLTLTANAFKLGGTLSTATDIALASNDLTFSGLGNIGIGTTTASYKLDVRGTAAAGQINAEAGLCINGNCKTSWSDAGIGTDTWTTTGSDIYFATGNVGIGTTTAPTNFKLQVNGNIGPNTDNLYNLGSQANRFNSIHLGPDNGLRLDNVYTDASNYEQGYLGYEGAAGTDSSLSFDTATESNFSQEDLAYNTTLTPSATTGNITLTLGTGNWNDNSKVTVGTRVKGNGGVATITSIPAAQTTITATVDTAFTSTNAIASGDWSLYGTNFSSDAAKLSGMNPDDSYTKLLLHADGSGNSFVDSSASSKTVTAYGDTTQSVTQSEFGGKSAYFDGNGDYLNSPSSGDFAFGTGDFTIDAWVYWAGTSTPYQNIVGSSSTGFTGNASYFRVWGAGVTTYTSHIGIGHPGIDPELYSTNAIPANAWTHVAVVRSSGNLYLFINGVLNGSKSNSTTNYDFSDNGTTIGSSPWDGSDGWYSGYMDEVRISKGIARWTSNFTPLNVPYGVNYPANTYYTLSTTNLNHYNTSVWTGISSATLTETLSGQNINYSASFDGRTTFKIYDSTSGNSGWRPIARNNSGTWEYNSNATAGATNVTWTNSTTNNQNSAISQAVAISANQMTGTQFQAVNGTQWGTGFVSGTLDLAMSFKTTDSTQNPTLDQITINYLGGAGAGILTLGTKAIGSGTVRDLQIKAGDNDQLYLSSNGNIGIGMNTPTEKLMIAGNIAPSIDNTYDLGSATNRWRDLYLGPDSIHLGDQTLSNSSGSLIWNGQNVVSSTGAAIFSSANINNGALYVDSVTGNVGIGTTSPTAYLNIKAGTATAGTAPLKFTTGTLLSATEGGAMEFDGSHIYFTAANAGTRYQLDQQSGTSYTATNGLTLNTAAFELGGTLTKNTSIALGGFDLNLSGLGNIGIGTTTASYKLDVRGTAAAGQINAEAGLCINGDCKTSWSSAGIGTDTWTTTGSDIYFTGGNVGIGTTSPQAGLHVATSNIILGTGYGTATPSDVYIKGVSAAGNNITGANMYLDAPNGTGIGGSGSLIFRTANPNISSITFDSAAHATSASANSVTFNHTNNCSGSSIVFVLVSGGNIPSGATYDGVSMTSLASVNSMPAKATAYYLVNPPTGTKQVVASVSSSGTISAISETYCNIDATNPIGTVQAAASSYGASQNVNVSSATNDIVVDFLIVDNSPPTAAVAGGGQTARSNYDESYAIIASSEKAGAATTNMSWTWTNSSLSQMISIPVHLVQMTNSNTFADRMAITNSGNIGIGITTPLYKLEVNGSAKVSSLNINGAYSLPTAAGTTSEYLRGDGTWAAIAAGMSGTGTTNYLSKFTGASSIGNSLLFDNGTAIGIGTETLAGARFKVALSSTYSDITDAYADETKIASIGGGEVTAGKLQIGPWTCGNSLTIAHTAGAVAPVTKTVTYGTVNSSLSGASECWITQNLGADNQATSATDSTEASSGWYWQFNRKQGYKNDGTTVTPAWTITSINENSNWTTDNDPCAIALGAGWRIPTDTELTNVNSGWSSYTDAYSSVLKVHVAGYLNGGNGALANRGSDGYYWSSTQSNNTFGNRLRFVTSGNYWYDGNGDKPYGHSVRCINDSLTINNYSQSTTTSTNLLSSSPAFSINNFHYNIATLPATSSIRIQFSKDNTNWYSAAGTLSDWTTISTLGGADIDLADFATASSWTGGNAFYYKIEINSTTDHTQTPTIEDIRLDYVPLSGSGGLVFDTNGNLGVGTFSPTAKLSIASGGISTGLLADFSNGNAESVFTILDNGNVGIGTSAPGYKLDIAGDVNITGNYKVNGVNLSSMTNPMTTVGDIIYGGTAGAPTRLAGASGFLTSTGSAAPTWTSTATDYFTQYAFLAGRSGGQIITGGTAANDTLVFKANAATTGNTLTNIGMQFKVGDSAATNALTILNNGNVGIGTTSPQGILEIQGASPVSIIGRPSTDSGSESITFGGSCSTCNNLQGGMRLTRNPVDAAWDLGLGGTVFGQGSTINALTILGGGNVGIGTTSPSALFSVGATSQFQVNASGNVTGGAYNGLTLTAATTGFTIAGGTTSKTLTVSNSLTLAAANDTSTLNIGTGGTLSTGAYATIANYAPIGQTMYIGTTAHAINRGTGAEVLTGITGLTPGANFTLTQNSVAALTSEETGAVANTIYLKAGNVGIGTTSPSRKLRVVGDAYISGLLMADNIDTGGSIYASGDVSALTFTDRTPYPKDLATAYEAVLSMERLPDGL
ncbi:MAG: FISUMP domain-containing protein, partial [Candidatus Moraniibacteriota bacterium]